MKYKALLYISLALNVIAYHTNDRLYFLCVAIAWILVPILLYLNNFKDKIVLIFLCFSFNNLIDELLQSNEYKQVSEYIFAIIVIYLVCRKKK